MPGDNNPLLLIFRFLDQNSELVESAKGRFANSRESECSAGCGCGGGNAAARSACVSWCEAAPAPAPPVSTKVNRAPLVPLAPAPRGETTASPNLHSILLLFYITHFLRIRRPERSMYFEKYFLSGNAFPYWMHAYHKHKLNAHIVTNGILYIDAYCIKVQLTFLQS